MLSNNDIKLYKNNILNKAKNVRNVCTLKWIWYSGIYTPTCLYIPTINHHLNNNFIVHHIFPQNY